MMPTALADGRLRRGAAVAAFSLSTTLYVGAVILYEDYGFPNLANPLGLEAGEGAAVWIRSDRR